MISLYIVLPFVVGEYTKLYPNLGIFAGMVFITLIVKNHGNIKGYQLVSIMFFLGGYFLNEL